MKEKLLKTMLIVPFVFFAQVAPPDDLESVPVNDYITPALLLVVLASFLVLKSKNANLTFKK